MRSWIGVVSTWTELADLVIKRSLIQVLGQSNIVNNKRSDKESEANQDDKENFYIIGFLLSKIKDLQDTKDLSAESG